MTDNYLGATTPSTFSERLALALRDAPRGAQSALARACGIGPSSVNDWLSGKTVNTSADLIFPAARYLDVSAEWLATGRGEMCHSEIRQIGGAAPAVDSLSSVTLGKAIRACRLWQAATGDKAPLEDRAYLILRAARSIDSLDPNTPADEESAIVMAQLAACSMASESS